VKRYTGLRSTRTSHLLTRGVANKPPALLRAVEDPEQMNPLPRDVKFFPGALYHQAAQEGTEVVRVDLLREHEVPFVRRGVTDGDLLLFNLVRFPIYLT
jgi:hypothetical protein